MIRFMPLRIFAVTCTILTVMPNQPAHAAPAAATVSAPAAKPPVQLPHISIVSVGKGSPVVLIPGLSSPRAVWDGVVPALAKNHEVLLVQLNGFSGDAPGANLQPGVLTGTVADLHGYLAKRKLTKVPVVGHSLGGLLTLMTAKAYPGDLGKAMIVDALPFIGAMFVPGSTPATLEPQAKAMRDRMTASYGQPANTAQVEATANGLALKPESRAKLKAWMLAADARVSGQALYEDMTTDVTADLPAIAAPLTVVVPFGRMLTEDRVKALYGDAYKGAPTAKIVTVGDSAHFVMLDQPAAFQTALGQFLTQ